jgi:hypothetical protein
LWSIGCRKLIIDAFLIKILFNLSVLKLGANVTPYLLDLCIKKNSSSLQELLEHLLYHVKRIPK